MCRTCTCPSVRHLPEQLCQSNSLIVPPVYVHPDVPTPPNGKPSAESTHQHRLFQCTAQRLTSRVNHNLVHNDGSTASIVEDLVWCGLARRIFFQSGTTYCIASQISSARTHIVRGGGHYQHTDMRALESYQNKMRDPLSIYVGYCLLNVFHLHHAKKRSKYLPERNK